MLVFSGRRDCPMEKRTVPWCTAHTSFDQLLHFMYCVWFIYTFYPSFRLERRVSSSLSLMSFVFSVQSTNLKISPLARSNRCSKAKVQWEGLCFGLSSLARAHTNSWTHWKPEQWNNFIPMRNAKCELRIANCETIQYAHDKQPWCSASSTMTILTSEIVFV